MESQHGQLDGGRLFDLPDATPLLRISSVLPATGVILLLIAAIALRFQVLYDLPFLKHSNSWAKKNVVGNWEFGPIFTFQSPEYATVQAGSTLTGTAIALAIA